MAQEPRNATFVLKTAHNFAEEITVPERAHANIVPSASQQTVPS